MTKLISQRQRQIPKTGVYDTGKVLIGLEHRPTTRFESSVDMDRLQSALLHKPRPFNWLWILYAIVVFTAIGMIVTKP